MIMTGLKSIIETMQGSGCSPFFITSAVQSLYFAGEGRKHQARMLEENIAFRERMQALRDEYSRERLDDQKLFRRESLELGRRFMIEQTVAHNRSRRKEIEFRDFMNHNYWPLVTNVYTALDMQSDLLERKTTVPLNVLVSKTELTYDRRSAYVYERFCEDLIDAMRSLPDVIIEKCPWKELCQSRTAAAMNVNYVMGGVPTLIVFPYRQDGVIGIETASWAFGRGMQSMQHKKLLKIKDVATERIADTTLAAVKAAVGMTRDAYMLAEYHAPVVYNAAASDDVLAVPALRSALEAHYSDMSRLVGAVEFRRLCLPDELAQIERSLNAGRLLNA